MALNVAAPIVVISVALGETKTLDGLPLFAAQLATSAGILFFATSFRRTRFLGEPERYLEMSAPFAIIAAVVVLEGHAGAWAVPALLVYFAAITAGQLGLARLVRTAVADRAHDLATVTAAINAHCPPGGTVRLAANSDEMQKYFMTEPWSFVRYWSYEKPFAGFHVRDAFDPFPILKTAVVEAAIRSYGATYCLMATGDSGAALFAGDHAWRARLSVLAETPTYRLYAVADAVT